MIPEILISCFLDGMSGKLFVGTNICFRTRIRSFYPDQLDKTVA